MDDTGADRRAADPWAPGGSMSTDWEHRPSRSTSADDDPWAGHRPRGRARRRGRTTAVAIGLTAVAVAAIVAVITVRRDDAPQRQALPTSSLPDVATDGSGATQGGTGLPDRATNIPPPTVPTSPEADDGGAAAGAPGAIGAVVVASRAPVSSVVELAPELSALAPTEVVALTFTGELVEISVPSGRVRATAVGFPTERARLTATDVGALVWPMPGGAYELVTVGGERLFVDGDPPTLVTAAPALDRFFVWTEPDDPDAPGGVRLDAVGANGDRLETLPALAGEADAYRSLLAGPWGGLLAGDTGGTYLVDDTGTTRVSGGDAVATGRNHVLLRECDERRVCTLVALDANGFRTPFAIDLPDGASPLRAGGVSPGGDALLLVADRSGSVDTPPELRVLELTDGSQRSLYSAADFPAVAAWSSDGSGVFVADVLLRYVDRLTGAAVVVSDELPKVREVATRRPAAMPACELLALALPVFDDMRAATGAPVAPPAVDILEAILRVVPDDVAEATSPMVDFVGSFVSLEQPESRRVENWPAEVRAGLTALDEFAADECRGVQT